MEFKNFLIVALVIATLIFSGCSADDTGTQDTTSPGAFMGGNDGVVMEFEPLSILEDGIYTIFDTEDFPIEIVVQNKGEHSLEAGDIRLELLGPAQSDFSNIPDWELENQDSLEEISEYNPSGGEEIVYFTSSDYATYDAEVTGYTTLNWYVSYDYDYTTNLIIEDVCFKGDLSDDRVCEVEEGKIFSVSGAPITVTSVEEDNGGSGIIVLVIKISNANSGESTIVGEEFDSRFSQVSYTMDDASMWDCKSGGREWEARLVDGEAEIICRLVDPLAEEDIYAKSVEMEIDYTYRDIISESLRVKESSE